MISQKKLDELHSKMKELSIKESDLHENFILASGSGGQKVQKSHTCVQLKHLPSGIEIKCQKSRSREDNRFFARRLLCEKLEEELLGEESTKSKEIEKIRKQKKRRQRRREEKNSETL